MGGARIEVALDAVEAGSDDGGGGQVGVAGTVGQAQLQPAVGDAHHGRAVVVAVADVGRGPGGAGEGAAHHQALVAVDRGGADGRQGRRVGQDAAQELVGQLREAEAVLVGLVGEEVGLALADGHVDVHAVARPVGEGLGHEGADHAQVVGDLRGGHLEQQVVVGGGQAVGEGVVDLELAVGVLVVDLIDVHIHLTQAVGEGFEELAVARQTLVVVTGLGQGVGGVGGDDIAVGILLEQGEFRLKPGEEGVAHGVEALDLLLQHHAGVQRPGLAFHMAVAGDAGVAGLPGHQGQGVQVADGHVVRAIGFDAEAPHREAGKTGPGGEDAVEMGGRHGLGLGRTVDVDKLGQHILDLVVGEKLLGFRGRHCRSPEMLGWVRAIQLKLWGATAPPPSSTAMPSRVSHR